MVARSTGGVRLNFLVGRHVAGPALIVIAALAFVGCGAFGGDEEVLPEDALGASDPTSLATVNSGSGSSTSSTTPTSASIALQAQTTTTAGTATSTSTDAASSTSAASTASSTATSTAITSTATTTPTSGAPGTSTGASGGCRSTATICVGSGQQVTTLAAAVAAATDGAVIELVRGRYNETVAVSADNVTIRSGPGGRSTIDCTGIQPAQGKACVLAVGTNLTVEDMEVTGARGPDNNEACFRNEPGTRYIVRNVECHGSNNGVLGSGGSWLIEDSYFHGNGAGDGFSHNLYLSGDCSEVIFRRSTSEEAIGGHAFKSRCLMSTIEGSTLRDNTVGDAAEFSYGGAVTIRDTVIHQPDGSNGNIVRHGAEGCRHSGSLTFINATISSDRSQGYIRSACQTVGFTATELPAGIDVSGP